MADTTFEEESLERVNYLLTLNAIPNIVITAIYLLLGIVGNSVIIYIYGFVTKSNINNKYFILVLAIVDIIACVVNCVFTFVLDEMQVTFTSPIFCKVLRVLCHVTALMSAFILLIIAIQRYLLVCRPFGRQMTPKWRRNLVFISVGLSCLLGFPAIKFYGPTDLSPYGFNVTGMSCKYEAGFVGSHDLVIYNVVFMLVCVSGIVAISILYACVVKKIYNQRMKFAQRKTGSCTDKNIGADASTTDSELPSMNGESGYMDSSLKRNISVASFNKFSIRSGTKKAKESIKYHRFSLMFCTITVICVVAFMPLRILEFMEVSDKDFVVNTFGNKMPLYRFLYTSYILNNIANPFIYGLFDREFRNTVKNIFRKH